MLASVNHWPLFRADFLLLAGVAYVGIVVLVACFLFNGIVLGQMAKGLALLCLGVAVVSAGFFIHDMHGDSGEVRLSDTQRQSLAHRTGFERMEGTPKFVSSGRVDTHSADDAATFVRSDGSRAQCLLLATTADQSWWGTSKVRVNQILCLRQATMYPVK